MDQYLTKGGNTPAGSSTSSLTSPAATAQVEGAVHNAHQTVDKIADRATTQVDRLSGAAHKAVDTAADKATSAARWASSVSEQAKQAQSTMTEAACTSIRARPISTVAGALVVGYLLGRLARF